jgi:hypothetical protein
VSEKIQVPFISNIVNRFRRRVEPLMKTKKRDEDIMRAVVDRIPMEGEAGNRHSREVSKEEEYEELCRRLVTRLKDQIKEANITTEEVLRSYNAPVNCIMLLKFVEKYKSKREGTPLRDRIIAGGWRYLQGGVWVLPPVKTPRTIANQDDLKLWIYQNLVKPSGKDLQYVFPFVSIVDLKKTIGDKKRVLKKPMSNTIFNVMEMEEIVPSSAIYEYLKAKNMSIEQIIESGDITFLAKAFADDSTMPVLLENKEKITRRLQKIMETTDVSLLYIASLDAKDFADALQGIIPHPADFAQRVIIEARYWEALLHGPQSLHATPVSRPVEAEAVRKAPAVEESAEEEEAPAAVAKVPLTVSEEARASSPPRRARPKNQVI